jgi:hypothetical protein
MTKCGAADKSWQQPAWLTALVTEILPKDTLSDSAVDHSCRNQPLFCRFHTSSVINIDKTFMISDLNKSMSIQIKQNESKLNKI